MRFVACWGFASLTSALASVCPSECTSNVGEEADDRFGYSVSAGVDFDGDGVDDRAVGAPWLDVGQPLTQPYWPDAGAVYLYSGADGELLARFLGQQPVDRLGASVAWIPTGAGEQYPRVLAGAPGDGGDPTRGGRAYLYEFDGTDWSPPTVFAAEDGDDHFGWSVASPGDVDHDGQFDLLVGAHRTDEPGTDTGSVYLYSGATLALIWEVDGPSAGARFGSSVAAAGDTDGDGTLDVVVGAPFTGTSSQAGEVHVLDGTDGALLGRFTEQVSGDEFGISVAGVGDLDGDATGDIVVGAHGSDAVFAYAVDSGSKLWEVSVTGGELFGRAVSYMRAPTCSVPCGTNGILIGAPMARGGLGSVYLVCGDDTSQSLQLDGPNSTIWFGAALAQPADITGGGTGGELTVGAAINLSSPPVQTILGKVLRYSFDPTVSCPSGAD